jgi:hypothetical protein
MLVIMVSVHKRSITKLVIYPILKADDAIADPTQDEELSRLLDFATTSALFCKHFKKEKNQYTEVSETQHPRLCNVKLSKSGQIVYYSIRLLR